MDKTEVYKAINRYQAERYDRIAVLVPKGDKAKIERLAKSLGMTASRLLYETLKEKYQI